MRISMKYNAIPTSCEDFQFGEVEDYTVVLFPNGGTENISAINYDVRIYPNPATDIIQLYSKKHINSIKILSIDGKLVEEINNNITGKINVSGLAKGVYIFVLDIEEEKIIHRFSKI